MTAISERDGFAIFIDSFEGLYYKIKLKLLEKFDGFPKPEDIDLTDLDMDIETLRSILKVDKDVWTKEAAEIEEHYKKFGDKLPKALREQLENLKAALK